jgi:hypothetical protein
LVVLLRGILIAVATLMCVACAGASEHELDGSVLIFDPRNYTRSGDACQGRGDLFDLVPGSPVKITPAGKEPVFTKLSAGEITPEGNCRLKFTSTLPEADSYVFEVAGREPERRQKSMIDGSNGSRDGWWVTFDWDFQ